MIAVDCSEAATLIQVLPISPTLEEAVQMMNEQDWDNYMINLIKPKQNNKCPAIRQLEQQIGRNATARPGNAGNPN